MNIDNVIRNVCKLPEDFHSRGNVSIIKLLEESGYVENRRLITFEILKDYISKNLPLIDDWIGYSEDQRCSPAWVFDGTKVYYLNRKVEKESENTFDDPINGRAYFIIKEIEKLYKFISIKRRIIRHLHKFKSNVF